MNKTQSIVISIAVILFLALYFGFDTSPDKHKIVEEQRQLSAVSTDITSLLTDAKESLSAQQAAEINRLEVGLNGAGDDTSRIELFKQLSRTWYGFEKASLAGYYAEQVAEIEKSEEAWSIAGTTYSICLQNEKTEKVRNFCSERAIGALEKALSLNPANIQHKINLALVYAENPPAENPMKGVLMLVDLNKQHPESVPVLTQLGRLAIKTGQLEKAVERLEQAVQLEPENVNAVCLLANALEGLGDKTKAEKILARCRELRSK